jgi:DNA-binding response OmpR family regulator
MDVEGKRVIFVEDDEVLLDLFKAFLERKGVEVTHYSSSKEAYDFVLNVSSEEFPDFFIFDYSMPYVNGYDLYTLVRQTSNECPIFMISGYHPEKLSGLDDPKMVILSKPVHPKQLLIEMDKFA